MGYKIEGKPVEQYWTEKITKHLVGKTITKVEYMTDEHSEKMDWYKKPITIQLDNDHWIIPMMDEGNDGGAIATTFEGLDTIPVI